MIVFKCPNCGRIYKYGDFDYTNVLINCQNCRYPLKPAEQVKTVRHPELNEHKVIGTVGKQTKGQVECPYCHSTNTKKISELSKVGRVALFGIYGAGRLTKQWHCKDCNSDF